MKHETADVHEGAIIGDGVMIWNWCQVREGAYIGDNTTLSKGVYIDTNVDIGDNVKIQNNVNVYQGVTIKNGVFIGPNTTFTNDKNPRAITPDGFIKYSDDWEVSKTLVEEGASIGANTTILPGITIGKFSMVGAGSVVTKNVPPFALVVGNPAKVVGQVNKEGKVLRWN